MADQQPARTIYSVSQLTENIKLLLEENFPIVWIFGEISNCRMPNSGHAYCTLKDDKAQISAVMFRGQLRQLRFRLEDGVSIVGMGRLTVYEPRGTYQIILEYIEPQGAGALQLAFEQLKKKLGNEGLFDAQYKAPLPYLPRKIGLITSPTGAAVRDFLHIVGRRFPSMPVDIYPVRVQGDGAIQDIVRAIACANQRADADVLVLTRGGGSIEDLAAYNSEAVARALFASEIPVISAVGHETDFSIADFVADLRAPTPSAAAELVVPIKVEVQMRCLELRMRTERVMRQLIRNRFENLNRIKRSLIHPRYKVQQWQMLLDDSTQKLNRSILFMIGNRKERFAALDSALKRNKPDSYISKCKSKIELFDYKLLQLINLHIINNRKRLDSNESALQALNPKAVLNRGYSITRGLPDLNVLIDSREAAIGQPVEIILSRGELMAEVTQIKPQKEE